MLYNAQVYPTGARIVYIGGEWVPCFGGGVDNTTLNTGTGGDVIATDDIGGVKYQIVKVSFGALDTATAVTTSAGLPNDTLDRAARDCGKIDIAMGQAAHDAAGAAFDPVGIAGWASAAAPTAVSLDGDVVKAWYLLNGSAVTSLAAAGTLIAATGTSLNANVTNTVAITANSAVNVAQVAGTNTVTGGVAGIIAVGGNVANAGAATANPVPVGGIFTTAPTTLTTGQTATMQFTAAQNQKVDVTTIAGTAPTTAGFIDVKGADGNVFVRQTTATNLNAAVVGTGTAGTPAGNILTIQGVAAMTKLLVTPDSVALPANQSVNVAQINGVTPLMGIGVSGTGSHRVTTASDSTLGLVPITAGGASIGHLISAATTNLTNLKAGAGQVYGWSIFNTNAAIRYVKLHNTVGAPTAGVGVVYTIAIPATGGSNIALPYGLAFSTGIAFSTVTGTADADTAAVAANDLIIDIHWK